MAGASASSRPAAPPPSGTMAGCPSSRSGGCWCAILLARSTRKPCSAPTKPATPCRCCAGSSSAGRSRSRSTKCATALGSRRNASGRTPPSHAPRPACSACSPSSPAGSPTHTLGTPRHSHQRLVSQAASNLLRHARRRPPGNLARTGFRHVAQSVGRVETPAGPPGRHSLRALPRRMMAQGERRVVGISSGIANSESANQGGVTTCVH